MKIDLDLRYDSPIDRFCDVLEQIDQTVGEILRHKKLSVDSLSYAVGLLHCARSIIPIALDRFQSHYSGLSFGGKRSNLFRSTGSSVRSLSVDSVKTKPDHKQRETLDQLLRCQTRFDGLIVSLELFENQLRELCDQGFQQFQQTKPAKRLIGDSCYWSIILVWLNRHSVHDALPEGHVFLGWADQSIDRSKNLLATVRMIANKYNKQRREGIKQPKGTDRPSISWFDRNRIRSIDNQDNKQTRGQIARDYLLSRGIIGHNFSGASWMLCRAYRAFRDHGIKQPTIDRWAERSGLDVGRVSPMVCWEAAPTSKDTDQGLVYVVRCSWLSGGYHGRNVTGFLVWFRDHRSEGFHTTANSPEEAISEAFDALRVRAEQNRRLAEAEKLRQLSFKQKRACLVRQCRAIEQFQLIDSYNVGNCKPGTMAFCARLGIDGKESIKGAELARLWYRSGYAEQSYFERVIIAKRELRVS
jgi:hypothetical protein